jgi:hypothetical protein
MQTETHTKTTGAIPPTSKFQIAREASVRDWHQVSLERIAKGLKPYPLAIPLIPLAKSLGLYPVPESASSPPQSPKAKPPAAPTSKTPEVKRRSDRKPKAATPVVASASAAKKPNAAKKIADEEVEDMKRQAKADKSNKALIKARADRAEHTAKEKEAPKEKEPAIKIRPAISNVAPTLEAAEQFQNAFQFFNRELFNNKLEQCMITWQSHKVGKGWARGFFAPDRWGRAKGEQPVHQISLCPITHGERDTRATLSTLVHEMCHQWVEQIGKGKVKPFHCKNWVKEMEVVGLQPIILKGDGTPATDKDGNPKKTGKNATHEIIKGGRFDEACKELMETGFEIVWSRVPDPVAPKSDKPKKPKTRIKHVCPKCGEYAVAKRDHKLTCQPCKKVMEPEEDDADLPTTEDEADDE